MSEHITCPECHRMLKVKKELVGRKVKCPHCGSSFILGSPTAQSTVPPPISTPPTPKQKKKAALWIGVTATVLLALSIVIAAFVIPQTEEETSPEKSTTKSASNTSAEPQALEEPTAEETPDVKFIWHERFTDGISDWKKHHYSQTNDTWRVAVIEMDETQRNLLDFWRNDSNNSGGQVYVTHRVDTDVSSYNNLRLLARVKVVSHSLEGSGRYSDEHDGPGEYPVHLYVHYKDASGATQQWSWGFLTKQNVNEKTNYHVAPAGIWCNFISQNLMTIIPQPVHITAITIGGNGWDFHGRVDDVSLARSAKEVFVAGITPTGERGKAGTEPPPPQDGVSDDLRDVAEGYLDFLKEGKYEQAAKHYHYHPPLMSDTARKRSLYFFIESMKAYEEILGRITLYRYVNQEAQGKDASGAPVIQLTYRLTFARDEADATIKLIETYDVPKVLGISIHHAASMDVMQKLLELREKFEEDVIE